MRTRGVLGRGAWVAWAAALFHLVAPAHAADDGFNVIVNERNPVPSFSSSDLKRVISGGTKVWDGGKVVQLGLIPSDVPETRHLATLLDTSPQNLLGLIQQQIFKGELRRPVILRSSLDCI